MSQDRPRFDRRSFLIGYAAGTGGLVLTATGAEKIISRFLPSSPEAEDLPIYAINSGVFAVHKEVHIRTSPRIPDRTRFKKPSNRIDWSEIRYFNNAFFEDNPPEIIALSNPELVEGQSVSDYPTNSEPWIKIAITTKSGLIIPGYISFYASRPHLEWLTRGDHIFVGDGKYINYSERGQAFVPSSPERVARDIAPRIWANAIEKKFNGTLPLKPKQKFEDGTEYIGERIIPSAEVVAAGDNWDERMEMERKQTPVNVRNFPAKEYYNSEPVEIMGKVKQGTEIRNLLADQYSSWSACTRGNIRGNLYNDHGETIYVPSKQIVAIYDSYLKY